MCQLCEYIGSEDPVKLDPQAVLKMIANRMKTAKRSELVHLMALLDKVIGFVEPENLETPSGLMDDE